MQLLVKLYDKTLQWSKHQHAPYYLGAVSFVDASVFPVSPMFMMLPMGIAKPQNAYQYALISTLGSVFGGILGYLLGYLVFKPVVLPLLETFHWMPIYDKVIVMLQGNGFWAVTLAGLTPLPFKFVAIGSGFMQVPFLSFLLASILGRTVKFYVLATLIRISGARIEQSIRLVLNKAGVFVLCLGALLFGCKAFGVI